MAAKVGGSNPLTHPIFYKEIFMEIERKFLIKEKPPIIPTEHFHTKQAYVSVNPEVRVREKRKTVKSVL